MKKIKVLALSAIATGIFFSCQNEDVTTSESEIPETSILTPEFLAKLDAIDINIDYVKEGSITLPDGKVKKGLWLDSDTFNTYEEVDDLMAHYDKQLQSTAAGKKQYVTPSRVNQNSTIRVLGFTGGRNGLSAEARRTLEWSVNNFNAENISLRFTLDFGTNFEQYDMVVYFNPQAPQPGVIASAGFPSGGRPNKFIQMYPASNRFSGNGLEAIITHEMGHSIGFRHTDWFSRQSCGSNQPEPRQGAVYVPGTPRGFDPTSIMLACARRGTDGEFNNNDSLSLEAMYPR